MRYAAALVSLLLLVVLTTTKLVHADDTALRDDVKAMLTAGFKKGSSQFAAAGELHDVAAKTGQGDRRVEYCWALVLIKHRKYDDAQEVLDSLIEGNGDSRYSRMWKTRIHLIRRQYAAAMVEMRSLAKTLDPKADDAHQQRTAKFLGRMVGFLEGPVGVDSVLFDEVKAEILSKLEDEGRASFDTSRVAITDKFNDYQSDRVDADADADAKDDAERERLVALDQIDRDRANLDGEITDIEAERTRIDSELKTDLYELSKAGRDASNALNRIETRMDDTARSIDFLRSDIARYYQLLDVEEDEARRLLYSNEIRRLDGRLVRLENNYRRYLNDRDRDRAGAALTEARNDITSAQGHAARSLRDVQQRDDRVRVGLKRLSIAERKANKKGSATSSRGRYLGNKARAFTTYEEFPLDAEKGRLLASFK